MTLFSQRQLDDAFDEEIFAPHNMALIADANIINEDRIIGHGPTRFAI